MHLPMHWKGTVDGSDPVHLLQVSPEGQSAPKRAKEHVEVPLPGGVHGQLHRGFFMKSPR